ncbi:MAG TPA: hypothetical protein PKM73_19285 [Verrucomicrobiota bacterium]|nr:hypothetical protein [Verrucomicrobiota bacterium]HNU52137.1 hypothetical protein [Verrucomicrobiota bacterium]
MTSRKLVAVYGIIAGMISLPFTLLHLVARPDDAPISGVQHVAAALSNYFGPWGVALVRLVDFPNAGMRSFRWTLALGLTVLGVALVAMARGLDRRWAQWLSAGAWAVFVLVWFVVGFGQIADGLL